MPVTITVTCVINALRMTQEVTCERGHGEQGLMKSTWELCTDKKDISWKRALEGVDPNAKGFKHVVCYECAKGYEDWMVSVDGLGQKECFTSSVLSQNHLAST